MNLVPNSSTFRPPLSAVRWEPGVDATSGTFLTGWAVSDGGSSFSVTVRGVAGASLRVGEFAYLVNSGPGPRYVSMTAPPLSTPHVDSFRLMFHDGNRYVGAVDLADPGAPFSILMPARAKWTVSMSLTLDEATPPDWAATPVILRVVS